MGVARGHPNRRRSSIPVAWQTRLRRAARPLGPDGAHERGDGAGVETTAAGPRPRPPASRATLDDRSQRRTSIPLAVRARAAQSLAEIELAVSDEAPNSCLQPTRAPALRADASI